MQHDYTFEKPLYGVSETLKLLGISRTKLYALIKEGRISSVKCGRRTFFRTGALAGFLDNL